MLTNLQPEVTFLTRQDAKEVLIRQFQKHDDGEEEYDAGWYARLNGHALGLLDCSDWEGPFSSEHEALTKLKEIYS